MTQIGFGHYNAVSAIRNPLYLTLDNKAYFCNSDQHYFFDLNNEQLQNIKKGKKLDIILTNQNYSEILKYGLKINPTFSWHDSL